MVDNVLANVDESVSVSQKVKLSLFDLVAFPPPEYVDVAKRKDYDRGQNRQYVHVPLQ